MIGISKNYTLKKEEEKQNTTKWNIWYARSCPHFFFLALSRSLTFQFSIPNKWPMVRMLCRISMPCANIDGVPLEVFWANVFGVSD